MSQWIAIAQVAECPPGEAIERIAEGRVVALFNVAGTFYAVDGVCPHQGGPLGQGRLTGQVVTCRWHGWQFDVTTGRHRLNATCVQESFAVRVERGEVLVHLGASQASP